MPSLKPAIMLTADQSTRMLEWANDHGRCVQQRSVRLPLNMYEQAPTVPDQPVQFPVIEPPEQDEGIRILDDGDEDSEAESNLESDQHSEYDTDSDADVETEISDVNNVPKDLSFLHGCVTRSGRMIKTSTKYSI